MAGQSTQLFPDCLRKEVPQALASFGGGGFRPPDERIGHLTVIFIFSLNMGPARRSLSEEPKGSMKTARAVIGGLVILLSASLLPAQNQVNVTVNATMDLYRAGGYNDGSDGIAPVVFTFPAGGWRTITFPAVGGAWSCSPSVPEFGADGTSSGCFQAGGQNINDPGSPFSTYHLTDFEGALAGVFLSDTLPASAPAALRFYVSNSSQGGIQTDFAVLSPEMGQMFFIGDGLTGTGTGVLQTFRVPPGATHLYLGYIDSCNGGPTPGCYSDNLGSLNVTIALQYWIPEWESATATAPSARCCSGLAYDPATYSALLFGGGNARYAAIDYGDTWIWCNGWKQLSPAYAPAARAAPGIAYDAATGTVVLFGGSDNDGAVFGDTWTWDGVTWTQQFPLVSPPARSCFQSMAYDPVTETVLLFGGGGQGNSDYGSTPLGDTWE